MSFHQIIPAKEIEQCWEMLLLKYKAEKRKMHAKSASGSGVTVSMEKWEYYDDFSFFDNCLDHRRVKSSIQMLAPKSKNKVIQQNLQSPSTSVSQSSSSSSTNKVMQQDLEQLSTSFSKPTLASKSKKRVKPQDDAFVKKKKNQSDELDAEINEMKIDLKKAIESITNKETEQSLHSTSVQSDNDDWLYQAIVKILESTLLMFKLDCMIDVQTIVGKYVLQH